MCDIHASRLCLEALEPELGRLSEEHPDGGVYAYMDEMGQIHAQALDSYDAAEREFAKLPEECRRRGILLQLTEAQIALVL